MPAAGLGDNVPQEKVGAAANPRFFAFQVIHNYLNETLRRAWRCLPATLAAPRIAALERASGARRTVPAQQLEAIPGTYGNRFANRDCHAHRFGEGGPPPPLLPAAYSPGPGRARQARLHREATAPAHTASNKTDNIRILRIIRIYRCSEKL